MTSADPSSPSDPESRPRPLYTARVDNSRGTSGQVRAHEGPASLDVGQRRDGAAAEPEVVLPTGSPSSPAQGFNPEQFLAMAWSTCLGETLRVVLSERGLAHESRVSVEVEMHRDPVGGFRFTPRAVVSVEEMAPEEVRELAEAAHARCPVSKILTGQGASDVELVVAPRG
ncbi:hypothetical protein BH708_11220 [Brachybacterium sp. P6-10-X1]|nr:hypothetical protein BH708_11220 [Brachybacterium sp. P6-10-X1]